MWSDRVVLVTGASRGLGAAFAKRVAKAGAHVVLTGRSLGWPSHRRLVGTLEEVAGDITAEGGAASAHSLDVRDAGQMRSVVDTVVERHGRLDVLVNNASAIHIDETPSIAHVDLMRNVNCRGTLLMNLTCLEHLSRVDGQILTLSPPIDDSRLAHWLQQAPAYAATKYAMTMNTLGFSHRVRANCIWPKRTIATAATAMLEDKTKVPFHSKGRNPTYFAEAMMKALELRTSGQVFLDEDLVPNGDEDAPMDMFV